MKSLTLSHTGMIIIIIIIRLFRRSLCAAGIKMEK